MLEIKKPCRYYDDRWYDGFIHAVCESNGSIMAIYEDEDHILRVSSLTSHPKIQLVDAAFSRSDFQVWGQELIDFWNEWPIGDDWYYQPEGFDFTKGRGELIIDPKGLYDIRQTGGIVWGGDVPPKHWNSLKVSDEGWLDFEKVFWWWKNHKDLGNEKTNN